MGLYRAVLEYAFACVLWGTLLALLLAVVLVFVVQKWKNNKEMSPLSWIISILMFFFVSFQTILLSGTFQLKSWGEEKLDLVSTIVHKIPDNDVISQENADKIFDEFHTYLNYYMLRRTLWTLLFVGIGTMGIIYCMERKKRFIKRSKHSRLRMYED